MRRSSIAVAVLSALLVLLPATPASAHATFVDAPSGYPTNTDQSLTMNVPHERDDTTYNVDVVVAMPSGWTALSCQGKATWSCSLGTVDGRQVARFTKASGAEVSEDETFQFTVRTASTVGTFAFPTVQTYNTGEIVRWIGAAGASNPAPMLATLPGGAAPQSTPSTTNPDAPPTTTTVVAPTATSAPTTGPPPTPATTTSVAGTSTMLASATSTSSTSSLPSTTSSSTPSTTSPAGDDDGGGGTTTVGLLVVIAIGAAGGLLVSRRYSHSRRRNSA